MYTLRVNTTKSIRSVLLFLTLSLSVAGQSSAVQRSVSSYNSLHSAVVAIGSTNAVLSIDKNVTCSTAETIPPTLQLEVVFPNKISKIGNCTITFQGPGLTDPTSDTSLFKGFKAGDIVFKGSTYPVALSSSLWDDSPLSSRLINAITALSGKAGTIVAYPGEITSQVVLPDGLSLHLTKGAYSISTSVTPFIVHNNIRFYGDGQGQTTLTESAATPEIIRASGVAAYPFDGYNENIEVRDITFKGNPSTAVNSALSAVLLGNVEGCRIERNTFFQTHGFAAFVGGIGTSGYAADGCEISENIIDGLQTQSVGTINGRNIKITHNTFKNIQRLESAPFASVIDIEPNVTSDICNSIEITDNVLDGSNSQQNWHGIVLQAANSSSGCVGGVISRNRIIGSPSPNVEWARLASGIVIQGAANISVTDNYIRGAMQMGISISGSRGLTIKNNYSQNIGGGGLPGIAVEACFECTWQDNIIENPPGFAADNSVKESELSTTANSAGSVITVTGGMRLYAFYRGLTLNYNGADYKISSVANLGTITVASAVGTVTAISLGTRDIDINSNRILTTRHGFRNGTRLHYMAGTGAIEGLVSGKDYYVVNATASSFQLAASPGASPVNLTSAGVGEQKFLPVLTTRFSFNKYQGNKFGRIDMLGQSNIY